MNRIKFIEIVVYKFFKIIDFYNFDLVTAITLTNFANNIFGQAKKVIYEIGKQDNVEQKKSFFDEYDKEEDEKYGVKTDESKEYYSTVNKYIMSLERYCRQKRIDINKRIDFLIEDIKSEIEYDEEHKNDFG